MKKIFSVLVVVIVSFFILGIFSYRSENMVPVEADLFKYPEFQPFLAGRKNFRGIKFNLDTNYYSFSFTTQFDNSKDFFAQVDADALQSGWQIARSERVFHTYIRDSEHMVEPLQLEQVTLSFDSTKQEVIFVREEVSRPKSK